MALEFAGILLFASVATAGLLPTVEVLQGPSSKTTLIGPDGSAVSSAAPGGTVVTNGAAGLVPAAPAVLASGPQIVVSGPAGSIATVNSLAGPAVVPAAVAAPAVAAVANPAVLLADVEGAEGAYVPDNTEQLYDNGSYNGEK